MKTRTFLVLLLLFGAAHLANAQEKKSYIRRFFSWDTVPYAIGISIEAGASDLVKGVGKLNERLSYLSLPGINTTMESYSAGLVIDHDRGMMSTNFKQTRSTAVETEVNQSFPTQVMLEGKALEFIAYRAITRSRRFRTMLLAGFSSTDYKLTLIDGRANNMSTFDGLFSNAVASPLAVIETRKSYHHLSGGLGFFYRNLSKNKFRFNVGMDFAYAYPIIRSNGWKQQFLKDATVYEVPSVQMDSFNMKLIFTMFIGQTYYKSNK